MSKKIIYLLSLLMALSLVFASCKKNGVTLPGNGPSTSEEHNEDKVGENGLFTQYGDIPADKPITKDIVLSYSGDRGYRNPVGVVMGSKNDHVLIFSELRYAKTTADNDIGVDGATAADIYLTYSYKSGTNGSFINYGVIGINNPAGQSTADKSHAAPVVFKVSEKKIVVVASGGVGISRVGQTYAERVKAGQESKIEYCEVTLTEASGASGATITTTEWQPIEVNNNGEKAISAVIEELSTSSTGWVDPTGTSFAQFGTHAARGYVDGDNLVLPVVVANQGKTGATSEYMGNLILVGAGANPGNPWTVASYTAFTRPSGNSGATYTAQKESRVIGKDSTYKYIAVPNGSATHVLTYGEAAASGASKNDAPTATSTFNAWDGSLGYLTLKWHGGSEYTVDSYDVAGTTADKSLLMHVKKHENSPTIYLVDKGTITVSSGAKADGWTVIDGAGKGSSIDVLGDGTVITVAEEYAPSGERKFDIVFSRYSQAYLNSKLTTAAN